jgi:exonuclease I
MVHNLCLSLLSLTPVLYVTFLIGVQRAQLVQVAAKEHNSTERVVEDMVREIDHRLLKDTDRIEFRLFVVAV